MFVSNQIKFEFSAAIVFEAVEVSPIWGASFRRGGRTSRAASSAEAFTAAHATSRKYHKMENNKKGTVSRV